MLGGIIGAAGGALGGVLGGISRNKALKQQMKMVNEQKKENQDWYDRRYNEDSTQRADAQAMLTQTAEAIKQRNQASAGSAAVMGGTEESVASTKAANAQAMADATSKIVVAGEQRKDQIENQYRERNNELNQQLQNLQSQKKDALSITSDAIGCAVNGFAKGSGLG